MPRVLIPPKVVLVAKREPGSFLHVCQNRAERLAAEFEIEKGIGTRWFREAWWHRTPRLLHKRLYVWLTSPDQILSALQDHASRAIRSWQVHDQSALTVIVGDHRMSSRYYAEDLFLVGTPRTELHLEPVVIDLTDVLWPKESANGLAPVEAAWGTPRLGVFDIGLTHNLNGANKSPSLLRVLGEGLPWVGYGQREHPRSDHAEYNDQGNHQ